MSETINEQLQERERRRDVAEGLRGILAVLNSNKPLDAILDYITLYACHLLEADAVAIYRLQPETNLLKIQSSNGLNDEYLAHSTVILGQGPTGQAVNQGKPVAVTNVDNAMDVLVQPLSPEMMTLLGILSKDFRSELSVPLIIKQDIVGALNLYYAKPRVFSQDDIDLAVSFCDQTALAIENARLREQAQEEAVTAERNRLARELHDSVTQTIFSASLIADVLPTIWEKNPSEAEGALNDLRKLTHGALAEMRTMLLELRPIGLGNVGIADLLKQLTEGVSGRTRAQVKIYIEGEAILPTEVKLCFYRIAQEALNNAAKHSGADKVELEIKSLPISKKRRKKTSDQSTFSESVSLLIRDNGRGFDPKHVAGEHLGLGIMQERASNAQIALSVQSKPGQGTEISLRWPKPEQ
jgi:two-component system nitrate/nitrite sensor histidine kinase NarX